MPSPLIGLVLAAAAASGPGAQASVDQFPELRPRAVLVGILKALDTSIADPRSITDVVLCPAARIKLGRDGRPHSWYVAFSMNSRTVDGGYGGRVMYAGIFKAGRPVRIARTQMATDEGIDHLINASIRKQMANCPAVPNDQLRELLEATDRPLVDVSE
jgi:hypothetical protein